MNARPTPPPPGLLRGLAGLALLAVLSGWLGCASGGTQTTTTATGSGGTTGAGAGSTTGTGGTVTGGTGGSSGTTCAGDEKTCGGVCVKADDPAFGCSPTSCDPCVAPPNATAACSAGACVLGACGAGFHNCDGDDANGCETDTDHDPLQCGACGSACVVPHAAPSCVAGKCGVATCENGYVDCDGDITNGCEAKPQVDPNNCGGCGAPCPATETCQLGVCGLYCPKGQADCNNDENDGCETPLGTVLDCAFCGDACDLANAASSCAAGGVCHLDQCDTGFANCDSTASNGCEVNTQTDASNCGSCGNVCPSGPHSTATCVNGGCVLACDPGYTNCDANPTTGCEVHTDADPTHCGTCTLACNVPHASPACVSGICAVAQCNPGFADCNGGAADGCEINTTNNPAHCGGCGAACSIPNGTAGCAGGQCTVGTCDAGWADCDGVVSNGCETHVAADASNCGTCGHVCNLPNATATCTGGICTVGACSAGFTDCNNLPGDGCEIHTSADPLNCGGCNHQCFVANGTAGCSGGNCAVAGCNAPFADCDNNIGNGCETDTSSSNAHCGTCANNCAATCTGSVQATTCSASTCTILACTAGSYDIDGSCATGCECKASPTSASCNSPSALGSLQVGQSIPVSGNLVPAGQEAYYTVTFSGNTNFSFHPRVRLTAGSTEFAFDILSNCSGAAVGCGIEGGNSTGKTDWEVFYSAGDPYDPAHFSPIPAVGTNNTIIIHVFRRPGKAVSCNTYTLTISN